MTDNALTMALGAVAEAKPYGAVLVTVAGTREDARALLPRVLVAMMAQGLVPCGDPAIESNGDGTTAIEVQHRARVPVTVEPAESPNVDTGAESTITDSADAKPTAKPKSGRWQQ